MSELIAARLRRRIRTQGAEPLLTYYDLDSGERTELSGTSFANWVNKTSNLLVDELMVEPGFGVELAVAGPHPGHWVTLIWAAATWQVGAVATSGAELDAAVLVTGPDSGWTAGQQTQVVACSLHPLGLSGPPDPAGVVLDYTTEVRGQPDQHPAVAQPPSAPAWRDATRTLTQAELVDVRDEPPVRRLVVPTDPWTTVSRALITPLVTGGSSVIVTGSGTADQLERIRSSERAL